MRIIDAHIHYAGDHPAVLQLLDKLNLKLLNVGVAHAPGEGWREHTAEFMALARQYPHHFAWCTAFEPPTFEQSNQAYADAVIAELEQNFVDGAVACKFWKNIGMEIRKPSGEFLMIDDPLFDPIYEYLINRGRPALMHIGEPLACWQPLDADNPHASYYRQHPEWHMGSKPDHPSHQEIIAARDRVLARHPHLNVIGAHLGSLEYDVSEIAARLDRYPNFAVDTSARLRDLMKQDTGKVRSFFMAYSDRILFGTDFVHRERVSTMDPELREAHLASVALRYGAEIAYFEVEGEFDFYGQSVAGLGLPEPVLARVLYENAQRWYPGLADEV
jgi:predicted TIM-barrel fold metal-dependent hydrolase